MGLRVDFDHAQGILQELFEGKDENEGSSSSADIRLIRNEDDLVELTPENAWDIYRNFADAFGLKIVEDGKFNPFHSSGVPLHASHNLSQEDYTDLEKDFKAQLQFTTRDKAEVAAYVVFMVLGLIGNICAVASLIKSRYRRRRIHLLLLNLTAADLIVASVSIPVEIGWRISASWEAGDWACRVFVGFARAFPLYASSLIIVVISLDRYYKIRRQLRQKDARIRARKMLAAAWIGAAASALFQMVVYQVMKHPMFPEWQQCVTFGTLQIEARRITYSLFCAAVMFFLPLAVILHCYGTIFFAVSATATAVNNGNAARETLSDGMDQEESSHVSQPTSGARLLTGFRLFFRITEDMTEIERARVRAMKISVVIVLAFLLCWSPYQLLHFWYIVHPASAENIPFWIQDALCFFAVSNSLVNPVVYGLFARERTSNAEKRVLNYCDVPRRVHWRRRTRQQLHGGFGTAAPAANYRDEGAHAHVHERPCSPVPNVFKEGNFHRRPRRCLERCNSDGFLAVDPRLLEGARKSPEEQHRRIQPTKPLVNRFSRCRTFTHPLHEVVVGYPSNMFDNPRDSCQLAAVTGATDSQGLKAVENNRHLCRLSRQQLPEGYQANDLRGCSAHHRPAYLASSTQLQGVAVSCPEYDILAAIDVNISGKSANSMRT